MLELLLGLPQLQQQCQERLIWSLLEIHLQPDNCAEMMIYRLVAMSTMRTAGLCALIGKAQSPHFQTTNYDDVIVIDSLNVISLTNDRAFAHSPCHVGELHKGTVLRVLGTKKGWFVGYVGYTASKERWEQRVKADTGSKMTPALWRSMALQMDQQVPQVRQIRFHLWQTCT